jgi:hypothetical protein
MAGLSALPGTNIFNRPSQNAQDIEFLKRLIGPMQQPTEQDYEKTKEQVNYLKNLLSLKPATIEEKAAIETQYAPPIIPEPPRELAGWKEFKEYAFSPSGGAAKLAEEARKKGETEVGWGPMATLAKGLWGAATYKKPKKQYGAYPEKKVAPSSKPAPAKQEPAPPKSGYDYNAALLEAMSPERDTEDTTLSNLLFNEKRNKKLEELRDDLLSKKPKIDLSPMFALIDKETGTSLTQLYNRPKTREENQLLAAQIDNLIEDRKTKDFETYMKLKTLANLTHAEKVKAKSAGFQNLLTIEKAAATARGEAIDPFTAMVKATQAAHTQAETRALTSKYNTPADDALATVLGGRSEIPKTIKRWKDNAWNLHAPEFQSGKMKMPSDAQIKAIILEQSGVNLLKKYED